MRKAIFTPRFLGHLAVAAVTVALVTYTVATSGCETTDERTPEERIAAERRGRSWEWNQQVRYIHIVKDHRAKSGNVCYAIEGSGQFATRSTVACDDFPGLIENPDPSK